MTKPVSNTNHTTRRLHPNRHQTMWRDRALRPIECPGHCHAGNLYYGDPADPSTETTECLECEGGRIQWFRHRDGSLESRTA